MAHTLYRPRRPFQLREERAVDDLYVVDFHMITCRMW
jgi:hypothetical protein